jgi:uncharacterized protein (TIGR03083 family)
MWMNTPVELPEVRHLFPEMRAELLRVLESLSDAQWNAPTGCEGWSVKDVALHLLADTCGFISGQRDNDTIIFKTADWDELIGLINGQNDTWVKATRRISRRLLVSLLRFTGDEMHAFLDNIDLNADAGIDVAWANAPQAQKRLHLARELTEFWMHHQHICEGAGIESLKTRRYLHPVLTAFVHALPRTYEGVEASNNTTVCFAVTGEAADRWYLIREKDAWNLYADTRLPPAATVTMSDDTAWRMFTKGIDLAELKQRTQLEGNKMLGAVLLNTVAILA